MNYALVDGKISRPLKGLKGICPHCNRNVSAKCGTIKVHHWAHEKNFVCDPWMDISTQWHKDWQNEFPQEWRERSHTDENGERHIADIKTNSGWVIEFQHSPIEKEEIIARNKFYKNIIWVFDGSRRNKDFKHFKEDLNKSLTLGRYNRLESYRSKILHEWVAYDKPVIYDFFYEDNQHLWLILPPNNQSFIYFTEIPKRGFVTLMKASSGIISKYLDKLYATIAKEEMRHDQKHRNILDSIHEDIQSKKRQLHLKKI